jgi:hypothetical protein
MRIAQMLLCLAKAVVRLITLSHGLNMARGAITICFGDERVRALNITFPTHGGGITNTYEVACFSKVTRTARHEVAISPRAQIEEKKPRNGAVIF